MHRGVKRKNVSTLSDVVDKINDAANLLKPALARGELRTIAATTFAEYKKYFETDAALKRLEVDSDGLDLLDSQVRACKRILDKLLANAQDAANDAPTPLGPFLAEVLDEWQLLRPEVHYQYRFEDANSAGRITSGVALRAALMNLLNNAADVSPERIEIQAHCDAEQFIFKIHDHGPGLNPENAAQAGSAFFTTKQEGRGLGLFLANATLEQLGGRVRLYNREGGGATTEVTLPLQANA